MTNADETATADAPANQEVDADEPNLATTLVDSPLPAVESRVNLWLHRADQAAIATIVALSLAAMVAYWTLRGGRRGELIEIEHAPPLTARYEVDINTADWAELQPLPGVGNVLARDIIASRERFGPFQDVDDLTRVKGIGPKRLESLRPFLRASVPDGSATPSENRTDRATTGG